MDGLEKHIKQALDGRRIEPSPGSWERLAERLPATGPKQPAPWMVYALVACLAGILLVALWPRTEAVREPASGPQWAGESPAKSEKGPVSGPREGILEVPDPGTDHAPQGVAVSKAPTREGQEPEMERSGSDLVVRENFSMDALEMESDKLILEKAREVVAQVELLEGQRQQVTQGEVDSLLRVAQAQILQEKLLRDSGTVDALALLAEVEEELNSPLRDQLFEALKAGYFKLRTAVSQRDH